MKSCPSCGTDLSSYTEYHSAYYEKNKEMLAEKRKKYYLKHKKEISARAKLRYQKSKQEVKNEKTK